MLNIRRASKTDAKSILDIAIPSFLDAHGHSASESEINQYVKSNFSLRAFEEELDNKENLFFISSDENRINAYSKISFNQYNENIKSSHLVKLERLYVDPLTYGKGIAQELLKHNIDFSKQEGQQGMWLNVWVENKRAISFYDKMGFKVVGAFDFKISDKHYNPNHVMYLAF